MVAEQHQIAGWNIWPQRPGGVGDDQRLGPQRLQHRERQSHRIGAAIFIIMLAATKHRDADTFQHPDGQFRVVPRHTGMGKARQVGIVDRHPIHHRREVAKARAKDKPQPHRCRTSTVADQGGNRFNAP